MPHRDITMVNKALKLKNQLVKLRRQLHQYPELSFQEIKTTQRIREYLQQIDGLQITVGKSDIGLDTGLVATVKRGEGKTIAIRADIDALPIMEENEHSYTSKNIGKMHACGHDGHTAIVVGTAMLLAEAFKNKHLTGTVKFIFQPAEEMENEFGYTGSPYMIEAGVLDDVDAVIALHLDPEHALGEVLLHPGASMANVDTFEAIIKGTGGHAAYPEHAIDPLWILSAILPQLYSLTGRKTSALSPSVISVGQITAGSSSNVIPDKVLVKGTIRSYEDTVRNLLSNELETIFALAKHLGGDYEFRINRGEPALTNNKTVCTWIEQTIQSLLPSFSIKKEPYGLGGEDFGYMTRQVPGAMFFLGASLEDDKNRGLHMPEFDFNEDSLVVGTAILSETAIRFLQGDYTF